MRRACPWDEADRRGVEVRLEPLPATCGGAVLVRLPERIWIVLDPLLSPVEQRCALAHELTHLDRGSARCVGMPASWDGAVAMEERRVNEEVARWLVPIDDLWILVTDLVAEGADPTARVVAAELQVTKPIARIALDWLRGRAVLDDLPAAAGF